MHIQQDQQHVPGSTVERNPVCGRLSENLDRLYSTWKALGLVNECVCVCVWAHAKI